MSRSKPTLAVTLCDIAPGAPHCFELCRDAVGLADGWGILVRFEFNGVTITAYPGEDPRETFRRWCADRPAPKLPVSTVFAKSVAWPWSVNQLRHIAANLEREQWARTCASGVLETLARTMSDTAPNPDETAAPKGTE